MFLYTSGESCGCNSLAHPPPPHFDGQITIFLSQHFQNRRNGQQGPITWPSRSPDFSRLDYSLWGLMKSLMYAVKSSIKDELLNRIMDDTTHIRNEEPPLVKFVTSLSRRATMCVDNQGIISSSYFISTIISN
jgi:hypothetical protein